MSLIFVDGFESYLSAAGNASAALGRRWAVYAPGGNTINLENGRFSSASLRCRFDKGDFGKSGVLPAVGTYKLPDGLTEIFSGFWMGQTAGAGNGLGSNGSNHLVTFYSSTFQPIASLQFTPSSSTLMQWAVYTSGNATSTAAVSLGVYLESQSELFYEVRIKVASSGALEARTGGTGATSAVNSTGQTSLNTHANIKYMRIGSGRSAVSWAIPSGGSGNYLTNAFWGTKVHYDDIYICSAAGSVNNSFIPNAIDCVSRRMALTGDSGTIGMLRSTGSVNNTLINDMPFADSSYVGANVTAKDRYTIGTVPSGSGGINGTVVGLAIVPRAKKANFYNPRSLKSVVRQGGTDYASPAIQTDQEFNAYASIWETNPATAAQWTTSEISNSEVGIVAE